MKDKQLVCLSILAIGVFIPRVVNAQEVVRTAMGWPGPLSNEECWRVLPEAIEGEGQPLPTWIRMLAREMPRTAGRFHRVGLCAADAQPG